MADFLRLTQAHRTQMLAHIEACLPEEACGLVGGQGETAEVVFSITNELHSPVRFRMDPVEQLHALIWLEERRLELLAIYHSHPNGPEYPSPTDVAEFNYPGTITLIWAFASGEWKARGFHIEGNTHREIQIEWVTGTI